MRARQLARFASVDYAGVICSQITANALPVLVISVLGPAAAGSFYIASLITSGVASVGISFATGLMVEATAAPHRLPEITRGALKRCVLTMGPATIVLFFGARLILRVYGGSYIAQTAVLFQLLALTLLPFCIETVAYSLDRIAGKPIRSTLSQLAIAVLTLGGSWLLFGRFGLNAVGVACLGADTAVALVAPPDGPGRSPAASGCESAAGQSQPSRRSAGVTRPGQPASALRRIAGVIRPGTADAAASPAARADASRQVSPNAGICAASGTGPAGSRQNLSERVRRRPAQRPVSGAVRRRRVARRARNLPERAPDGAGHPSLLLGRDLRVERQRQQLPGGSLGDREVAGPIAKVPEGRLQVNGHRVVDRGTNSFVVQAAQDVIPARHPDRVQMPDVLIAGRGPGENDLGQVSEQLGIMARCLPPAPGCPPRGRGA